MVNNSLTRLLGKQQSMEKMYMEVIEKIDY